MSQKIYVGNLPWETSTDDLRSTFAEFGTVIDAIVMIDTVLQRSRGFGFVTYETVDEASHAIASMNDKELGGRKLRVNVANAVSEHRSNIYQRQHPSLKQRASSNPYYPPYFFNPASYYPYYGYAPYYYPQNVPYVPEGTSGPPTAQSALSPGISSGTASGSWPMPTTEAPAPETSPSEQTQPSSFTSTDSALPKPVSEKSPTN